MRGAVGARRGEQSSPGRGNAIAIPKLPTSGAHALAFGRHAHPLLVSLSSSLLLLLAGCRGPAEEIAPVPPKAVTPPKLASQARPPLPGDFHRGQALFDKHCLQCHGAGRRGTGPKRNELLAPPADLRDPIFLSSRTDEALLKTILQGGLFVGASKWMPGFAALMSDQEARDVVALLRGDSIYLTECFPEGTHYVRLLQPGGPPVLAAYKAGPPVKWPAVVAEEQLPQGAVRIGYVMFADLNLPDFGPTPTGFVADVSGRVLAMRVALPLPDNERVQADLEEVVRGGGQLRQQGGAEGGVQLTVAS
jgi:mono/diheme cytochrome c family protein